VTTNLLARGIDIKGVSCVINLELPYNFINRTKKIKDFSAYIHRVGRTGRFARKGIVLTMVEDS